MDREIWQTSVHGVTKSQTQGSDSAHTHIMEKGKKRHAKGKFGLGVWNEAGQRQIEFCQENALVIANILFNNTREDSTHGHHQMVNTKIRLIIFFAAKDVLHSQPKQDWELTVAQIMNFLLPNSD